MKGIHNSTATKQIDSKDYLGHLAFEIFLRRQPDRETDALIVIMDEVIRKNDQEFWGAIDDMRNDTMMKEHSDFLLSRLLVRLSTDERENFDGALHIMPQWKMNFPITVSYLHHLEVPVAKLTYEYVT